MKQLHCLLALGFLLLSNGIVQPAFAVQENPTPASELYTLKGWVEAGSFGTATVTPDFPDHQWWERFHDPDFSTYIQAAIRNNPSLSVSLHRVEQARALVRQNVAQELPSLNFNPNYARVGLPSNNNGLPLPKTLNLFALPLQASYELDLWGQNLDRIHSTQRQAEATEFQMKAAINSMMGDVATAYFNLLRADALVQSQKENLALLQRIQTLKKSQNQAGLIAYEEVLRAERDSAEAETNLTQYKKQQSLFAHQLSILTGSPPAAAEQLQRGQLEALTLPEATDAGLPSDLLKRRPDILAQEKILESAKLDISVARKAFFPKVNLSAAFALGALQFSKLFDWGNFVNLQSVGVSQPLFKGGRLKAELQYSKAKQKEQLETYRQTILNAFKDVEDSLTLVHTSQETLDNNQKRLLLTEKDLNLTNSLVQQGLAPKLNALQSQSEVLRYRQLALQSKADTAVATVSLYKALGGGF